MNGILDYKNLSQAAFLMGRAASRIKYLEQQVLEQKLNAYERVFQLLERGGPHFAENENSLQSELEKYSAAIQYEISKVGQAASPEPPQKESSGV